MVAERTGTPPHSQVKLSGIIPPLAEPFHQRPETGLDLRAGLYPGDTVVLTHGEDTAAAPVAQGGTGKTQLAVAFTHALWGARAVEALVWVSATSREAIITGFAQAARTVGAAEAELSAEAAADRFIGWLARTRRPWALILDDLVSLADLENLWPSGPAGQVVITTRLPETVFRAGPSQAPNAATGPRIAPVGGFSRREVLAYLSAQLTDYPDQRAEALDLGGELDGLPLGLAQAAAVMTVDRLSCREYRGRFGERREHMSAMRVDGVSPAVLATWSLAAECAHQLPPAGVAWPALALAAMLDPHGIPGAVLTSPAGCGYVAGRPSTAEAADQTLVQAAMTNLARVGLVSIDPASPVRTVRMHASVQAAVRAYLPPEDFELAVLAAAEALMQAWPEPGGTTGQPGQAQLEQAQLQQAQFQQAQFQQAELQQAALQQAELEQVLRDCTGALWAADSAVPSPAEGGHHARPAPQSAAESQVHQVAQPHQSRLWQPEAHPVLFRKGVSLEASGLAGSAITHWQSMLITSTRLLGNAHANAVTARDRLAVAYESAGRFGDAIAVFSSALADRERNQGPEHPDTIAARGRLAHAYSSAGRPTEAVALYEQMADGASRQLGPGHPVTLAARASLAGAYQAAARGKEALTAYQMLMADSEKLLGARHPVTLATRDSLAAAFLAAGQPKDAIEQYKRLVADTEEGGYDHPDAIAARASLASAYGRSGKLKDAIALYQRVLADLERIAGADHPDAIAARVNLAFAYRSAGQLREAIPAYERALADRERVQGPDHADTRSARASLAAAYQQAGRLSDAIHHYEQALADSERMLGPGDLETLTARSSLAAAQFADGQLTEAIPLLQRTLADSEHYLGPDHPMTRTVRENLGAATRA